MMLVWVCLIIFLMFHLNNKGKAYREQKRRNKRISSRRKQPPKIKELAYRKELQDQGYSDDLITTVLPTIMNDKE